MPRPSGLHPIAILLSLEFTIIYDVRLNQNDLYVGEIQCKNGISLEKMKNFQNEATDFNFIFVNLKLLIGATNAEGPEKYSTIPFGILGPSKFTDSV